MKTTKRTKIVCTIGPASSAEKTLQKMIKAGMNVARLNFSHGFYADHKKIIFRLKRLSKSTGEPVAIIADLQGPKIRVGELPAEGIKLIKGEVMEIPVTYLNLYRDVKRGDRVLLEDGLMDGECVGGSQGKLKIKIHVGGTLLAHKGLNFPDSTLKISSLTEKDKKDAFFAVKQGVHFIAMSFVTNPRNILQLRQVLKKALRPGQPSPMIIAKIEKHEAIKNFDKILKVVDAVMVARGDLGVEIPAEQVPLVQKEIIEKCREAGKPVIVATQMLESMIYNPRPTRAEVSDVANAVIDHTDAVMLSGETATGKYPVEVVSTMTKIIAETEASPFDNVAVDETAKFVKIVEDDIGGAVNLLSHILKSKAILVATFTGSTACLISRFRPELPIIVATVSEFACHQMNLSWAVHPLFVTRAKNIDQLISQSVSRIKKDHLVKKGGLIIVLSGQSVGKRVNFVEVKEI